MAAPSARIYLDNAATSWPKPAAVYDAVDAYQRNCGAAVGRGATRQAGDVRRIVDRCRERVARLLGSPSADSILLAFNGTDALNIALHGVLRPGDHVVTTTIEHNSVLRPLAALRDRIGIEITQIPPDSRGIVNFNAIERAITSRTRLIAMTHASNVTGAIQPVGDVARLARSFGMICLIDAAQSAGHLPIDVEQLGVDLLACSGHKGLLGPLGTGLLYIKSKIAERVHSFRQGGTGSRSESAEQPGDLPDKFESGNHNAPGLVGLEAALGWIEANGGVAAQQAHERALVQQLLDGLKELPSVTLYGPLEAAARTGVVSLNIAGLYPQDAAAILDESFGIETRAGLHCAPGAHASLGTLSGGGTVRLSVGPFVTSQQITATIAAIGEIAG